MSLIDKLTGAAGDTASSVGSALGSAFSHTPTALKPMWAGPLAGPSLTVPVLEGIVASVVRDLVSGRRPNPNPTPQETALSLITPTVNEQQNPLRYLPLGEEISRVTSQLTSPVGLATLLAAPGATLYGTAGAIAGGQAGRELEMAGIDPRLRIPLGPLGETNIGPRAGGEILGGLYMGPRKALGAGAATETAGLPNLAGASDEVLDAHASAQRLMSQVDDAPLGTYDVAHQVRQGNLAAAPLDVSYERWLRDTMTNTQGAGTFSSPVFRPLRFVLNKLAPSLTMPGEGPEWIVHNYVAQIDDMTRGAEYATQGLVRAEKLAGGLDRVVPDQTLTGRVLDTLTGSGVPLSDQPIRGIAAGKGGLAATWDNIISHPKAFTLTPAQQQAVDAYQEMVKGYREAGARILRDAGKTEAQINEMLPEVGDTYFHRVRVDADGAPLNSARRYVMGAARTMQQERVPEEAANLIRYRAVDSLSYSAADYAQEVGHVVLDNAVWLPALKRYGVPFETLKPAEFAADIARLRETRDWLARARQLARDAKFGRKPGDVARRARDLMAEPNVPEETRRLLDSLNVANEDKALPGIARQIEKDLKAASVAVRDDLAFANDQSKYVQRMLARGDFNIADMQKFPGLSAYRFDKEFALRLGQEMKKQEPVTGALAAYDRFQRLMQAAQAGTSDVGFFGLQLVHLFTPQHWHLIPAVIKNMWSEDATRNWLLGARNRFSMDGTSMSDQAMRGNLRLGVEVAQPLDVINRPGGVTRRVGGFLQNWPVNKAFTNAVNIARQGMFEDNVRLIEYMAKEPITIERLRAAARNAGTITGDFNWQRAGVSSGQQATERTALRFAPGWFRSQLQLIRTAASPVFGTEQNLARYALANLVVSVAGIYSAAALAAGQTPHLDPTDYKNFMTLKIKGVKMGPGGPILSLMRTAGYMATLAEKAANGDEEALRKLIDIKDTGNPLTRLWRGGAPTLTGLLYDIVRGRESYGDNNPLGITHPRETATALIQAFEPFEVQALREEGAIAALGQGFGGRAFPVSAPEKFVDAANAKAKSLGFGQWSDVPKATQAEILRSDGDLGDLKAEQDKYYERFGSSPKDTAFRQIDQSRAAVEDTLLASYAAVQAGTLSLSDFRQRFSDLQGQHSYLSNTLLDSVGGAGSDPDAAPDYYARLYTSIQPEQFDADRNGVIDDSEWDAWNAARKGFWEQYPQAQQYREYITQEYPTRNWKSPEMAAIAGQRYQALDLYQQFLDIPKYRGLTADDASFVDQLRSLKGRVTREAEYRLAAQSPAAAQRLSFSARQAWGLALQVLQESGVKLTQRQVQLFGYAVAMDRRGVQQQMFNPQRASFIEAHPTLAEWYPSVVTQAGLGATGGAALGLPETGTSSADLVSQLAA